MIMWKFLRRKITLIVCVTCYLKRDRINMKNNFCYFIINFYYKIYARLVECDTIIERKFYFLNNYAQAIINDQKLFLQYVYFL